VNLPFVLRLAWNEGRGAIRSTWMYSMAVALGVGALVAVHGFRADADRSVRAEARSLLGADLRMSRRDPFPDSVRAIVDSLVAEGATTASVVSVPSMVLSSRTQTARLFQVRGVQGGWPFYGNPSSDPPGAWPPAAGHRGAFVDPAVLIQLDARLGDTLLVGEVPVPITATIADFPAEMGFQAAVGPRVFIPMAVLEEADLLRFGSLARYQTFVATADEDAPDVVFERYRTLIQAGGTSYTTADWRAEDLSEGLQGLSRFLGIVGLAAVLLGAVGVANAVHVFVRAKLTNVAVLRCLGATRRQVLTAYVIQAGAMGLVGSVVGVGVGMILQLTLPTLLTDLLPIEIAPRVSWVAVALGFGIGLWTTVAFALGPLLPVRNVSPLRALRADFEEAHPPTDRLTVVIRLVVALTLLLLAVIEAPTMLQGVFLAAGLGGVVGALWALAVLATRAVRRFFPDNASYVLRQGVANLFRPRNQTIPVVLSLGFGVFVVGTIVEVERNLSEAFSLQGSEGSFNVLLFDIQTDQRLAVEAAAARVAASPPQSTPLVPARIVALNGRSSAELLADTTEGAPSRWALRREHRNTYRSDLKDSEELVAGSWWSDEGSDPDDAPPAISMETSLADALGVGVGDRVSWSLGGREVETEIRSLRRVDWARFDTNFYVVFEPGLVETAPHTWVTLARVESDSQRAALQRDIAVGFKNVSVLDLAQVQKALDSLLSIMRRAIRFLAAFAGLAGVVILAGAVTVTRSQRTREAAILKTLGARRRVVFRILAIEYVALGVLAVGGALVLSTLASWSLIRWLFELDFRLHLLPATGLVAGVIGLALTAGLIGSRGVLARPPLRVLRELTD
jgi:putative ABC transport system permease protein